MEGTENQLFEGAENAGLCKYAFLIYEFFRFDRLVDEELRRRRDSFQVMLEPITSDPDLLQAVDHYIRAENIDTFTGAVRAAEAAAAKAQPDQIEEAAVQGARGFQVIFKIILRH